MKYPLNHFKTYSPGNFKLMNLIILSFFNSFPTDNNEFETM